MVFNCRRIFYDSSGIIKISLLFTISPFFLYSFRKLSSLTSYLEASNVGSECKNVTICTSTLFKNPRRGTTPSKVKIIPRKHSCRKDSPSTPPPNYMDVRKMYFHSSHVISQMNLSSNGAPRHPSIIGIPFNVNPPRFLKW